MNIKIGIVIIIMAIPKIIAVVLFAENNAGHIKPYVKLKVSKNPIIKKYFFSTYMPLSINQPGKVKRVCNGSYPGWFYLFCWILEKYPDYS